MSGLAPAGTPSIDSRRGSFAIFSTWLKSLKVNVSGSWEARSRAVEFSASRAVITVSATATVIGVSPDSGGGGVAVPSDGVVGGGDDSTGWLDEPGLPEAVSPDPGSGPAEQAAHNTVAKTSGRVTGQVAAGSSRLVLVRSLNVMASTLLVPADHAAGRNPCGRCKSRQPGFGGTRSNRILAGSAALWDSL